MKLTKQIIEHEIDRVLALSTGGPLQYPSDILWVVAQNMTARGGSFVKVLGELYMRSDGENQRKVLETWPNYFIQYHD